MHVCHACGRVGGDSNAQTQLWMRFRISAHALARRARYISSHHVCSHVCGQVGGDSKPHPQLLPITSV